MGKNKIIFAYIKMNNIKVLILGYYGQGDAGDEAILSCLSKKIKENFNADITVVSGDIEYTKKEHNLHAVRSVFGGNIFSKTLNYINLIDKIRNYDIFVLGGGGVPDKPAAGVGPVAQPKGTPIKKQKLGRSFVIRVPVPCRLADWRPRPSPARLVGPDSTSCRHSRSHRSRHRECARQARRCSALPPATSPPRRSRSPRCRRSRLPNSGGCSAPYPPCPRARRLSAPRHPRSSATGTRHRRYPAPKSRQAGSGWRSAG